MEAKNILKNFGTPTGRSMAKSMAIHVLVLIVLMVIPAQALFRNVQPNKELDIVFYRPPENAVKPRPAAVPTAVAMITSEAGSPPGAPAPALRPKPNAPAGPDRPRVGGHFPLCGLGLLSALGHFSRTAALLDSHTRHYSQSSSIRACRFDSGCRGWKSQRHGLGRSPCKHFYWPPADRAVEKVCLPRTAIT